MSATATRVTYRASMALTPINNRRLARLSELLTEAGWHDVPDGDWEDEFLFAHAPTDDECPWLVVRPNPYGVPIYECWFKPDGWEEEGCATTSDIWLALHLLGVVVPEGTEL